jgi:tetratricopeptide (TPR) repeat protein
MINKKVFFRGFRFCALSLFFCGLILGAGCSRVSVEKASVDKKTASCDQQADKAIEDNDYETGIRLHQRLLEKEPENPLALYHLGYAYGHMGDHQKEVYYYERAIALGMKDESIFYNLGLAYGDLDQLENAIQAFKKAIAIEPGNLNARFDLSRLYIASGDFQEARHQLQQILKIDPSYPDARGLLESIERE